MGKKATLKAIYLCQILKQKIAISGYCFKLLL